MWGKEDQYERMVDKYTEHKCDNYDYTFICDSCGCGFDKGYGMKMTDKYLCVDCIKDFKLKKNKNEQQKTN